jgi:dTDP-4-amino-4,6-dideoxygalactose transaminase
MAATPQVPFLTLAPAYEELRGEIDAAIQRVLSRGHYIMGEELAAFEREYAEYTEAKFAVGVANGLDALVLALEALGVGPGDEVIVPANTYIATWLAVSRVGATIVPVEPDPRTCNLDPARVAAALTTKTKVVLPVHLFGQPADLGPILDVARARGVAVVEDAAQCHGARYRGRRIGAHGDVVAWSFYPGKNLGALGDGGAITTDRADVRDRVMLLRNYGSRVKYYNEIIGHNSRLDELQAAVLRVKLRHLDAWNARRHAHAARYDAAFADARDITPVGVCEGAERVNHLYVVEHPRRDAFQRELAAAGVGTLIHYPVPPHLSGAYASLGFAEGTFPITEHGARTHLSLPMGPHLSVADQSRVVHACLAARA